MLKKYNVLKDGRVQHVTATDFNTAKVGFSNAFGQIPTKPNTKTDGYFYWW